MMSNTNFASTTTFSGKASFNNSATFKGTVDMTNANVTGFYAKFA